MEGKVVGFCSCQIRPEMIRKTLSTSGKILCLDDDTFSLMMISKPFSPSWALGLTAFVFQAVLGVMIAEEQLRAGAESSTLEIPFKVDYVVRLGQLLTIILCLATQDDVLTSVQTFLNLGGKSNWDTVVGIEGNRSRSLWITRVFFPCNAKANPGHHCHLGMLCDHRHP